MRSVFFWFLLGLCPCAYANELALTTALELPQPLTLGVQIHRDEFPNWDAFAKAGFFSLPLGAGKRSLSALSMEVGSRYHPLLNGFYLAGSLGYRRIGVTVDISNLKQDGVALASTARASMGTVYVSIGAGHEWRLSSRLGLGIDVGLQWALLHSGGIAIDAEPGVSDGTDLSVSDQLEMGRISGLPLPQIAVLRLVWYL